MSKFLYSIYKLNIESYKKWWLYHKKAGGSGILSEILQGFSFNLENTLNRKFKLFEIEGNSVQDGSPSPDNEVPILSAGDNENLFDGETITFNAYDNIETAKDGLVTTKALSNTGTSNVNIRFPALNLSPDTYYISMDIRIKSGTGDFVKLNDGATDWSVVSKPTISSSFQRYI